MISTSSHNLQLKSYLIDVDRGTLLSHQGGSVNTFNARRVKAGLRSLHVFRNENNSDTSRLPYPDMEAWKKAIGERLRYNSADLRKNIDQAKMETPTCDRRRSVLLLVLTCLFRVRRIMGAYVDGKPFAVELVAAVNWLVSAPTLIETYRSSGYETIGVHG